MASFNWTPGIGDPTFVGWLTVALYFVPSISCWRLRHKIEPDGRRSSNEYLAWRFIAILFLALAINKQLDSDSTYGGAASFTIFRDGMSSDGPYN